MKGLRLDPEAVLAFWFQRGDATGTLIPLKQWFSKDPLFDQSVRDRFGPFLEEMLLEGRPIPCDSPRQCLASIVLLDQFTRNAYRDTPKAFAGDALARTVANTLVSSGGDAALEPLERVFVYLPFEHSESLADQDRAVSLFSALSRHGDDFAGYLDYARRHREVILRFGRFPHRNEILGRISTPEELAYLAQPGSGF